MNTKGKFIYDPLVNELLTMIVVEENKFIEWNENNPNQIYFKNFEIIVDQFSFVCFLHRLKGIGFSVDVVKVEGESTKRIVIEHPLFIKG